MSKSAFTHVTKQFAPSAEGAALVSSTAGPDAERPEPTTAIIAEVRRLRRWLWGNLPEYNGYVHAERVRGWQLMHFFIDNGWAARGAICCISGKTERLQLHSEDYYDWRPYTISQSVHLLLHRRFRQPDAWRRIVDEYAITGEEWFARLPMVPVDLAGALRAKHGPQIADIFTRAPIPERTSIPHHQIYRQPQTAE
ncbi:hypothetical protein [Neorhizobium sp. LjRoot104]|uniref:hypothetical protein n=1 Tax=Neorhizobium sp. LjRoot104 TaxID=3342254 RepID=UPI003ECEC793